MSDEYQERRSEERRTEARPYAGLERRRYERRDLNWGAELRGAVARLVEVRAGLQADEFIDERTRLNAHDIDLVLEQLDVGATKGARTRVGGE